MSDGFMTWYLHGPVSARLVDWLTGTGAVLPYPGSDDGVSVLDLEGDRDMIARATFMSLLQGIEPMLTFQMWYSSSEDLIVTLRRHLGGHSPSGKLYGVSFDLDGLTTEQVDSAVLGADALVAKAPEEVAGIVIDRRGVTADFDWDSFMSGNGRIPPLPERLVMSRRQVETAFEGWGHWSLGEPAAALATLRGIGSR